MRRVYLFCIVLLLLQFVVFEKEGLTANDTSTTGSKLPIEATHEISYVSWHIYYNKGWSAWTDISEKGELRGGHKSNRGIHKASGTIPENAKNKIFSLAAKIFSSEIPEDRIENESSYHSITISMRDGKSKLYVTTDCEMSRGCRPYRDPLLQELSVLIHKYESIY